MSLKEDDLLADDDGLCLKDDYDDDALLDGEDDLLGPDPSEAGDTPQVKEPSPPVEVPVTPVAIVPPVSEPVKTAAKEESPEKEIQEEPKKPEHAPKVVEASVIAPVAEPPKEKEKEMKDVHSSTEEANDSESDDEAGHVEVVVHQDRLRERDRDEDDEEEQPRGRSSRFQQERVISTRGGKPRQGIPDSLESVEIPTIGGHHHHRFPLHHQHQQQHGQNAGGQSNSQFQPRGGIRGRGGRFRHDRPRPFGAPRGGIRNPPEHHPRPRHQGPLLRFPPNVQPNNTSPTSSRSGGPGGHGGHGGHGSPPGGLPVGPHGGHSGNSIHHQQLAPPPVPPNLNLPPPGFPPPGLPLPPPPLNGPPPPLPPLGGPPLQFPPPPLLPPPPPMSLPPPAFPPGAPPPLTPMFTNPPPPLPPPNLSVPPPPIGGHPPAIMSANKPGQKIYVNKNFRPPPASGPELTGYPPPRFDTSVPPPLIGPAAHLSGGYRERSRSPLYRSPPRYRSPPPRERDLVRFRDRRDRSRSRSRSRERDDNWAPRDRERDYHRDLRLRDRFDGRGEHRYRDNRELGRGDYGPPREKRDTRQRSPIPNKEPSRPLDEFELKLLEQKKERERVLKMKEERRRQAVRERLGQQQHANQGGPEKASGQEAAPTGINGRRQKVAIDPGAAGDQGMSKESKEDKQKRQVILTNVEDVLDERAIGTVFSKFDVERIRILRERKAAFVFLRNPRDAETFCRRNPELSVGSYVLKVSYAVELAKKRHDGR